MIRTALLAVLAVMFVVPLAVAGTIGGVNAGEKIPHDLAAQDQSGQAQSFESLRGEKGLVLVFVRSADWCPFCQAQLIELGERGEEIISLGYNLATLSYDSTDKLAAFAGKYDFGYTMLSDPDSEIIRAFGILNEDMEEGSTYYGVPHPGVYIIGNDGFIRARLFEEDYKQRPQVESITETIKGFGHL